eukprot:8722315-Pyramimonas_sp.AAC.1
MAASTAAISQVGALLELGAGPNLPNGGGATPLGAAWANKARRDLTREGGGRKGAGVTGKGRPWRSEQG